MKRKVHYEDIRIGAGVIAVIGFIAVMVVGGLSPNKPNPGTGWTIAFVISYGLMLGGVGFASVSAKGWKKFFRFFWPKR